MIYGFTALTRLKLRYSLRGSFEQPLHHASLVVFQQGEVEAVLVGAAAAPAFIYRLHLHQRAMGVIEHHETLRTGKEGEKTKKGELVAFMDIGIWNYQAYTRAVTGIQ